MSFDYRSWQVGMRHIRSNGQTNPGMVLPFRVENKLAPDYARFHASLPRPEGPRQSLRSSSRSDSLRGFVIAAVLKCTIAAAP